jgi:hypothetical protein
MNKKQLICLWVGIAAIGLIGIFPPWVWRIRASGADIEQEAGYKCILLPPERQPADIRLRASLDIPRLCVQWFVVAVITGGLIYTFTDKRAK